MRRSLLAGFGIAAVLVFAACTDSPRQQSPLAPTEPSLAAGDQCSGALGSQIVKEQKVLFTDAAYTDMSNQYGVIKSLCPNAFPQLMTYIESMIGYSQAPTNAVRAGLLVDHLASVTLYVTGTAVVRPLQIFQTTGGAGVLSPGEFMTTWDDRARLDIPLTSTPATPHLYTFEAKPNSFCGGTTTLRVTGNCYDVKDYPHETLYTPSSILTLCLRSAFGTRGIVHEKTGFGAEVLPSASISGFSCSDVHTTMNSWLGTDAGPVGRVLAKAIDYLRPRPLFADDAGESGEIGAWSLVGGALVVVFEDGFTSNTPGPLLDGTDPVVGDNATSWDVDVQHPGYIQVQNGFGGLQGNVVVLSQALGNCSNCPTTSLLGTRVNPSATDTIGSYEITWTSLQDKPSVKEAPFVVRSFSGDEIARLSYVSEPGASVLKYNGATVTFNGAPVTWAVDVPQDFKITVNLLTLNGTNSYRTSLAIKIAGVYQTVVSNAPFRNADPNTLIPATTAGKTATTIGYFLSGIDAGVIAADNFLMKRLADQP